MQEREQFIAVLFILSTFFYILDVYFTPNMLNYDHCKDGKKTNIVLFFHHLIFTFSKIGFLANDIYILSFYVVLPFLLALHWHTNNVKCIMTEFVNNICNFDKKTTYFKTLFDYTLLKDTKHFWKAQIIFTIVGWFIGVIKLYWLLCLDQKKRK